MPPLRRNGKLQACEPCRKGKLACDHTTPFCGRCVRRKITARCIYHPAPMTKVKPGAAADLLPSPEVTQQHTPSTDRANSTFSPLQQSGVFNTPYRPEIDPSLQNHPSNVSRHVSENSFPLANNLANINQTFGEDRGQTVQSTTESVLDKSEIGFRRSAKYYGPTSFSAVFSEHADLSDGLLDVGEDTQKHPSIWPFGKPLMGMDRPSAPCVRMNQVVRALCNIPSKEICFSLFRTFENNQHHIATNVVLIRHCLETLWATFGNELNGPRSPEKFTANLTAIAEVLFKNEEKPFPPSPDDGMEWLNTFMGPNLRFEMLGLLFCFFGMAYQTLQDWDELFKVPENYGRDRKQTSWRMKECADVCLKMCEISEENNEISLALQTLLAILESVCTGDESFQLRRRHGAIVVCTIAAGLHRLPDYSSHKITAASEYKRMLFSSIYDSDKGHASLNGIPPALSARFCCPHLPLDLGDEELFLPQDQLQAVVSKLDRNGWNTSGTFNRVTVHRGIHLLSSIREEILELSLGVDVQLSEARIDDLYQRCKAVYDNLPDQLRYYAYDQTPKSSTGKYLIGRAYLMLNYLQNRFLIDRVAVARGYPKQQDLLNVAMETMDVTIMFWIRRDQLMAFSSAFDWIITCYGIPSAGVMCVELLKQASGQSVLKFSRSDAIQKLTMFIGFLEWVRPTDGNYLLAGRLKKVVRRILDHVLDPPPKEIRDSNLMDMPIDPMLAPFGEMDWLNTIDWTQGSWMEFN